MSEEQDAAVAIRKFLVVVRGLVAIEPGLESLASIKRAETEAATRLGKVRAEVETERGNFAAVKTEVGALRSEAADLRKIARDATSAKARQIAEGTQGARNVLDGLNAEIEQREARLAEIEGQISALREKFQPPLKG